MDDAGRRAAYEAIVSEVMGEGSRFEMVEAQVDGVDMFVFKHARRSLRELFVASRRFGDRTFLVYEDERWSFDDFMESVDALAAALVDSYGIRKGDRVAIAMRNYPEWIVSFAAVTSVGAVSVSFNAWWVTEEIGYALADSGARLLIADDERIERAARPAQTNGVRILGVRVPAGSAGDVPFDRWEDVVDPAVERGASMPDVEVDQEDYATILYTSGTTGRPKGAVSTNRAVIHALTAFGARATVAGAWESRDKPPPEAGGSRDAFILIVPLFHVTGCVPVLLSCVSAGLKLVMMYRWEPQRALELIERESVTNFVGVPTQSWDLLESPDFGEYDTSSLKRIGGGGAPAPPRLVQRVSQRFTSGGPTIGYGMTETNGYGPQNSGPDYLERPTSTGRATPIMQVDVRDPMDRPVPRGDRGEICLKGPMVFSGYWNRPDATAEVLIDGWMHTGDLGRMDEDGFVYVEDRAKDMVLRGGENVYSAEVEAAIYEHPAVYEAAVYGVPHERLGEEVAATVSVRYGESLAESDLLAHLAQHLAAFKVPTRINFVEGPLPRNASGKILKRELRDAAAAGT